jgi:chemotaxis protein methyltransferase CheR
LKDAAAYIHRLKDHEDEADALLAALSIHVSQFFRNPHIFALLEKEILPSLLARALTSAQRQVKIWSVGCAGGEEPYSIALLCEHQSLQGIKVSILGSDVSQPILEQARDGLFDGLRVSEVPPDVLKNYFVPEGRGYRLIERMRRKVEFCEHNVLTESAYPAADLILCRNVLIYFSRQEQDRILHQFADVLSPGGYLVLGNAENMLGSARSRFQLEFPAERIYRCL